MKIVHLMIFVFPLYAFGQVYKSDGSAQIPEMTIRIAEGYVYVKGATENEYKTVAVPQHAEIYFSIPENCECGVMEGQYSGVLTKEFLELFTPYYGVLPVVIQKP